MAVYTVTRNGVSKTIQPGFSINESANGRNRMTGDIFSLTGGAGERWVLDDAIAIAEDGVTIFAGLLDSPVEQGLGGVGASSAIRQRLSFVDYNVYPSRITVGSNVTRAAETLKVRLTWIAGLLSAQGVTLDAAQVNGPTLLAVSYSSERYLIDVLNETVALASGSGATSWVWNIDYSKKLLAIEAGSSAAPFNVTDGDQNVLGDITVEQPRPSDYANYIIVLGGTGTRDVADSFTGDGATTTFALNYPLAITYGYVTMNSVAETLGTGAVWSYNSATNSITRTSAPPAAAAITMTYVAQFPKRVIADSGGAAASRVQRTYPETGVFDIAVMQALADSYLARDSQSPKTVRYNCAFSKVGLHPGQTQTITSTKRNLSGTFLITEVQIVHVGGELVQRRVVAVSTTRLPSTLREKFQQTIGGGSSSTVSAGASSGGNDLSQLNASNLTSGTVPLARLVDLVDAQIAAAAAIAWTKISKTGSSLADLITRSAADLTSGILAVARLPTAIPAANIANGTVLDAEYQYLDGVTSGIQAQLNDRIVKPHVRSVGWVTFFATFGSEIFVGLPGSATAVGVITNGTTAVRQFRNRTTTAVIDNIAGWRVNTYEIVQSRHDPLFRALIRTGPSVAAVRIFVGLTSFEVSADAPVVSAPAAVGVQFSTSRGDAGWRGMSVYSAGISSAADQSLTAALVAVAADTDYDITVSLTGDGTLATFTVNGVSATLSTNLPAGSKAMGFEERHVTLEAVAKIVGVSRFYVEWD